MKLSSIKYKHIIEAGKFIDKEGIPNNYLSNNYWVKLPNKKEYPFKYLTRIAYQLTEGNEGKWLDFESTEGYRNYIASLGVKIKFYKEGLSFFNEYEVDHFTSLAGKPYRKKNIKNVEDGEKLILLARKANKWAELSVIEDYWTKKDRTWQWSGTFKEYLWHKIFKDGDSGLVYFVVGIGGDGDLFINLQCQTSNHTQGKTKALSKEKIAAFNQYKLEADHQGKLIHKTNLNSYSWDRLVAETRSFIYRYSSLYDELESLIKTDANVIEHAKLQLPTPPPLKTKSYVVNVKRNFKGYRTDWTKKQTESQRLGIKGEELVINYEKEKLKNLGLNNEAEEVQKKLDGEGYDIISYDEMGKEIYIEVKTTPKGIEEPFYLSINEKEFCEKCPKKYLLYRLYNYNQITRTAEHYILTGEELLRDLTFSPITFEISKPLAE